MLRFNPDDLNILDWDEVEAVDREPTGPDGHLWPDGTPLLRKLAAWGSYGIWRRSRDDLADDDSEL